MDLFMILIILGVISSVAGPILWFVFFVWIGKKVLSQRKLDNLLPQLDQMLRDYNNLPANQQALQKAQIMNMLMQASTHMNQLNNLHRQRYDLRVSELQSIASSAGIDWQPPGY